MLAILGLLLCCVGMIIHVILMVDNLIEVARGTQD